MMTESGRSPNIIITPKNKGSENIISHKKVKEESLNLEVLLLYIILIVALLLYFTDNNIITYSS